MAGALADAVRTALSSWRHALQRCTLTNLDSIDTQFVDIGTIVMFGICNSRLQNLLHDARGLLRAEGQDIDCLLNLKATDLVGD